MAVYTSHNVFKMVNYDADRIHTYETNVDDIQKYEV